MTIYRIYGMVDESGQPVAGYMTIDLDDEDHHYCCYGGSPKDSLEDMVNDRRRYEDCEVPRITDFEYHRIERHRRIGVATLTVGTTERAYGGPEEGGWWYDHFSPIRSFTVPTSAYKRMMRRLEAWCERRNPPKGQRWSTDTIHEVRHGLVETTRRPHYC